MNALVIRPCRDLDDVAAVEASLPTRGNEFHRKRFERADGSTYLLAWFDGAPVGNALLTRGSKYAEVTAALGPVAEVNGLDVAESARRRGFARALLEAAATRAGEWGHERLGLAVDANNEPAIRLYERFGFVRHPDLDPVDEWQWTDEDGRVHEMADPCTYWTMAL